MSGSILAVYSFRTGYFPELDFSASADLILYGSFTSMLLIAISVIVFLPLGLLWKVYLAIDSPFTLKLYNTTEEKTQTETFRLLTLSFSPFFFGFLLYLKAFPIPEDITVEYVFIATLFFVLCFASILIARHNLSQNYQASISQKLTYAFMGLLSLILSAISAFLILKTPSDLATEQPMLWFLASGFTICTISSYLAVPQTDEKFYKRTVEAVVLAILCTAFLSSFIFSIPSLTMKITSFGNIKASIYTDIETCNRISGVKDLKMHKLGTSCTLKNVHIISRIGKTTAIKTDDSIITIKRDAIAGYQLPARASKE